MADEAYISHATPRRVRFKIPTRRGDTAFFERVKIAFRNSPLDAVETNALTGSVLLYGDQEKILRFVAERNMFTIVSHMPNNRLFEFARLRAELEMLLGIDARSIFFMLLSFVSLIQIWRGNVMPSAIAALWYATDTTRLHRP